ncbi:MAG: hypothetical protein L0H25_09830 [Micrococcales bacterium]|nr:hypothetical protein [Micrococcales bacterium]
MTDPAPSKGRLFAINLVGAIGLVFGILPIVRYLLGLDMLTFSTAPYDWLELRGPMRFVPPIIVLAVCFVLAWWLEHKGELG